MMDLWNLTALCLTVFCLSLLHGSAFASASDELDAKNLYSDGGLVVNLDTHTFYKRLINSEQSWLVLFYLSWCGHCIDYVPTYLSVADGAYAGWSKYLKVSAINCAQDINHVVCREHNVTSYPTLKFLPAYSKNTSFFSISSDVAQKNDTLLMFALGKVKELDPHAAASPHLSALRSRGKRETTTEPDEDEIHITAHNSSALYYGDLAFAVCYSLETEVGGLPEIKGEALKALKNYLSMLNRVRSRKLLQWKYFPDMNQEVKDSIAYLHEAVRQEKDVMSHNLWAKYLNESKLMVNTKGQAKLIRCKGSEARYRGYPCSLWSLFHTMTVQAASQAAIAEENKANKHLKVKAASFDTLVTMRGYISNFFTCEDCRRHFSKMAEEIDSLETKSNGDCVIWLWNAHNRANKRLAGQPSEDPAHPKIQFPSDKSCPHCRTPKGMWDEEVVYDYLHSIYTDVRHNKPPFILRPAQVRVVKNWNQPRAVGSIGPWEISLCYVIYALCGVVIAALFYCIVIRQRLYLRNRKCHKAHVGGQFSYKPIY